MVVELQKADETQHRAYTVESHAQPVKILKFDRGLAQHISRVDRWPFDKHNCVTWPEQEHRHNTFSHNHEQAG